MAPEEVEKPTEAKPEEVHASAEATASEPAAAATEPAAAAPPTPPVDPVKQMGDAAHQVGASVDKAFSGVDAQNKIIIVALLSIFVTAGAGAIVNGQVMKGVAVIIAEVVLFFGGFLTLGLAWLLMGLVRVLMIVDAVIIASRKAKGEQFGEWDFFWKPAPA
jgi:hypothetical protein